LFFGFARSDPFFALHEKTDCLSQDRMVVGEAFHLLADDEFGLEHPEFCGPHFEPDSVFYPEFQVAWNHIDALPVVCWFAIDFHHPAHSFRVMFPGVIRHGEAVEQSGDYSVTLDSELMLIKPGASYQHGFAIKLSGQLRFPCSTLFFSDIWVFHWLLRCPRVDAVAIIAEIAPIPAKKKPAKKKERSIRPVPEILPCNIQDAVRLLSTLFQDNPEPDLRCLHRGAIKRALKVHGVIKGKRKSDWRDRLESMFGLDPDDPRKVVNQKEWDLAWKQFSKTWRFSDAMHRALKNQL
jgi:hypothetical protein